MLALLLSGRAPQTPEISFDHEVARLDTVLAKLGEASGVKLNAPEPLAHEIVFLHVDKRPLDETLQKIAQATCAEWRTETDGSRTLFRSDALRQAELRKAHLARLAQVNKQIKLSKEGLNFRFTPANLNAVVQEYLRLDKLAGARKLPEAERDKAYDRLMVLDWYDPTRRLLARCLNGIDMNMIADLPPQGSVIFASRPNQAQRALSPICFSAMEQLSQEQAVWAEALKKIPSQREDNLFQTDEDLALGDGEEAYIDSRPWQRTVPFTGKPTFALLKISSYYDDTYRFDLKLFEESGRTVARIILDDWDFMDRWRFNDPPAGEPVENPKFSAPTAAFFRLSDSDTDAPDKKDFELLKPFLDDPVQNEPLWLGNQELLTATAKFKNKSVIACLPDDASIQYARYLDLQHYLAVPGDQGMDLQETDHWVEFRPISFTLHWQSQASRAQMAVCVRSFREKGWLDLVDYAKLFVTCGPNADYAFGTNFILLADPNYKPEGHEFTVPYQSGFVELLAKLEPTQLQRLERGETIPYRQLTPEQRALAQRIVFGIDVRLDVEGEPPVNFLMNDTTMELPGGLLQGGGLSATMGEDQVVLFHSNTETDDTFYSINLTDDSRGYELGGSNKIPPGGMQYVTYDVRKQRQITLKCGLSPGRFVVGKFMEPPPPQKTTPVPFNQLPKDIQAKIKDAVQGLEEEGRQKKNDSGGKIKPPPPQ